MELRFKNERKDSFDVEREGVKKEKWYNKLWDVAANIGKTAAKVACIVTVPVIVASCTCNRIELEGDAHSRPDVADVSHEDAPDIHDAVGEDITHEDVIEDGIPCEVEDVPEMEIPAPCENLTERYELNNLIGDYLNRRLDDRGDNVSGDSDAEYFIGGSDVSENANPFTDGEGGNIGPSETFMHRISGTDLVPLADTTVVDDSAAKTYNESQNIWVRGSSYYSDTLDDVTGDVRFVAYTMKFSGVSNDFGIPVCTTPVEGNYAHCTSSAEDANYDYSTELHKVRIQFLGSEWLITELSPPVVSVTNEIKVQNGGYVKLGKERIGGIVDKEESLLVDCLWFRLDDIEEHDGTPAAVISVLDEYGNILKRNKVFPGQTKEFNIEGRIYRLHVWNVAPGYTFRAVWADMSIFSDEIKVEDGQHLDPDYDRFRDWEGVVGWKNKDAAAIHANFQADHLRTIGVYADDVADISSSGDVRLPKGEGFNFPYAELSLCYDGLDITDVERSELTFELAPVATIHLGEVFDSASGSFADCEITPPFVVIRSDIPLFAIDLGAENNLAYVATNGAQCDEPIGSLESGALFMKLSPSSDQYAVQEYNTDRMMPAIRISLSPDEFMGSISWGKWDDGAMDSINDPEREVDLRPEFVFRVAEGTHYAERSEDYAFIYFATTGDSFNLDVNYIDAGSEPVFRSDNLVYQWAGPVNERRTFSFIEEGTITERGSVFASIDDTQVVYYIADRVAYSVYYVGIREY